MRTFEQLETRDCPAVAAFTIDAPEAAVVGEVFEAKVYAQEFDPRFQGLARVALTLNWTADFTSGQIALIDSAITDALPAFRTGTSQPQWGMLDDLGGSAFIGMGRDIGNDGPEYFATLHFVAVAVGDVTLTMQEGRSRIVAHPTATFVAEQFRFESHTIHVGIGPLEAKHESAQGNLDCLAVGSAGVGFSDLCFAVGLHQQADAGKHRGERPVQMLPPL